MSEQPSFTTPCGATIEASPQMIEYVSAMVEFVDNNVDKIPSKELQKHMCIEWYAQAEHQRDCEKCQQLIKEHEAQGEEKENDAKRGGRRLEALLQTAEIDKLEKMSNRIADLAKECEFYFMRFREQQEKTNVRIAELTNRIDDLALRDLEKSKSSRFRLGIVSKRDQAATLPLVAAGEGDEECNSWVRVQKDKKEKQEQGQS